MKQGVLTNGRVKAPPQEGAQLLQTQTHWREETQVSERLHSGQQPECAQSSHHQERWVHNSADLDVL